MLTEQLKKPKIENQDIQRITKNNNYKHKNIQPKSIIQSQKKIEHKQKAKSKRTTIRNKQTTNNIESPINNIQKTIKNKE